MSIFLYDSFDSNGVPSIATAVAGYVDGGDYNQLVARFPHAKHLSIATNVTLTADCLDCENGDANPFQVDIAQWMRNMQHAGRYRPCFYASIDNFMPKVIEALSDFPRASYRLWVAHWGAPAVVPSGYDGLQFKNTSAYDESVLLDDFFAPTPKPPTPKPPTLTAAQKAEGDVFVKEWPAIRGQSGELTKQLNDECYVFMERLAGWKLAKP